MLTGPALADLARRTRGLAIRFDQVRRDTDFFDVDGDCPNTARRIAELAADAETMAELETLLADLQRAERGARPVTTARRPGPYIRILETLGRITPAPDTPVRLTGDRRA